jgi:hypothetical protein
VGADIYDKRFEDELSHLLRLWDVVSLMSPDTIHTFGLGIAKRILRNTTQLVKHFAPVPGTLSARTKILYRDGLLKELDQRMQCDDLTWVLSSTGGWIRRVYKSIRAFTNVTAKEYQYAVQKLLIVLGPADCAFLPEYIAKPLRKVLMMLSDMLLLASFNSWKKPEFNLASYVSENFSLEYREVFYRYAGTTKRKKKRAIIDKCTFNKLHNISHISTKALELGVMLHTDTQRGEEGMRDIKTAYAHTQRRKDDSTEYQMLFYMSMKTLIDKAFAHFYT